MTTHTHTLEVRGEGRCSRGRKETLEEQTATKQLLDSASLQPVIYCRAGWELSMVSANWVSPSLFLSFLLCLAFFSLSSSHLVSFCIPLLYPS